MKFLHHLFSRNEPGFHNISGYDDIKDIVIRALDAEENYNLLFIGPPASSKTLFLMGIQEIRKDAVYFDGSNTTSRILDILEQERPKIILLDEVDKMGRVFQEQLLNFLESGHIKVDQMKRRYDFTIKNAKVFGSANDLNKLSAPLRSRFRRLHLPKYTRDQFLEIAVKVCPKLSQETASMIGEEVWKSQGDIRDIISISKLVQKSDGPTEIAEIINTMKRYGDG
jgi:Holliday junction resolvasome RuvABC ATP-dependent DNA helicase subunit